jgi:hypothetical protein
MARKNGWVVDEVGKEHPENSMLLALERQELDGPLANQIRQHVFQCPRCLDMSRSFEDAADVLGTLETMQRSLRYPDVPPERVFNRLQAEAARYERRLSTRIMRRLEPVQRWFLRYSRHFTLERRVSQVYAALILILLLTMLAFGIVFAASRVFYGEALPFIPAQSGIPQVSQPDGITLPQHQAPSTANQTGQGQSGARIWDCTNNQERKQSLIGLCGSGFKPGDKVAVLLTMPASGEPKQRRTVIVDNKGKIDLTIAINHCNVPLAIVVHDLTNTNVYSNTLQGVKFGGCRIPSPNAGNNSRSR